MILCYKELMETRGWALQDLNGKWESSYLTADFCRNKFLSPQQTFLGKMSSLYTCSLDELKIETFLRSKILNYLCDVFLANSWGNAFPLLHHSFPIMVKCMWYLYVSISVCWEKNKHYYKNSQCRSNNSVLSSVYKECFLVCCHSLLWLETPPLPLVFFLKVTHISSSVLPAKLICLSPCFPAGPT